MFVGEKPLGCVFICMYKIYGDRDSNHGTLSLDVTRSNRLNFRHVHMICMQVFKLCIYYKKSSGRDLNHGSYELRSHILPLNYHCIQMLHTSL